MALVDFEPERRPVNVKGKPLFEVRGLDLTDVSHLVRTHLGEITEAVALYRKMNGSVLSLAALSQFMLTMARDLPNLVSEVISIASDEQPRDVAKAKAAQLGVFVQGEALFMVIDMTLEDAGGLKNLLAALQPMLRMNGGAIPSAESSTVTANSLEGSSSGSGAT